MPMLEKYRHYFNIDPDYFPAVNEAVIILFSIPASTSAFSMLS